MVRKPRLVVRSHRGLPRRRLRPFGIAILALLSVTGCHFPKKTPSNLTTLSTLAPPESSAAVNLPTRLDTRLGDEVVERLSRSHAAFAEGLIRQMQDDTAGQLEYWDRAHQADPGREDLAIEIARRRLARKEPKLLLPVLERATTQPGATAEIFSLLGLTYLRLGQVPPATEAYRRALEQQPNNPERYASLAQVLIDQGRTDEALATLDQGLSQAPADPGMILISIDTLDQLRRRDPARVETTNARFTAWLERATRAEITDPAVLLHLAELNKSAGKTADAERLFKASKARAARNPVASARLAEIYLREGKLAEAREQLEAFQRDEPTNPTPLYYLGLLEMERRDFARAEELFQRVVALDPGLAAVRADLAAAQLAQNNPAQALTTLTEARAKFASDFRVEFLSGLAASRLKNHAAAVEYLLAAEKVALTNKPTLLDARFQFQVGLACSETPNRQDEAEARLQKALAMDPTLDEVQNALGYLWADAGKKLPEARQLIEAALVAEPKNPAYLDSLGWVLFKQGDQAGALKALSEAVELMSQDPDATLLDHKADVLAALGRWAEARTLWEQSLKLTANPKVQRKLDESRDR